MTEVKKGDTVRMHYKGTLAGGEVFDSSEGRDPLEFVVGSGQIIPGLDKALPGMKPGESARIEVPCAEAYGAHDPEGLQAVERGQFPDDIPLNPGTQLQVRTPEGKELAVTIYEVREDEVILDANHPLAGRDLVFEIDLVEIVAA